MLKIFMNRASGDWVPTWSRTEQKLSNLQSKHSSVFCRDVELHVLLIGCLISGVKRGAF